MKLTIKPKFFFFSLVTKVLFFLRGTGPPFYTPQLHHVFVAGCQMAWFLFVFSEQNVMTDPQLTVKEEPDFRFAPTWYLQNCAGRRAG